MEYLCGTGTATSARSPGTPAWKRCNRHRAMRSSKTVDFGRPDDASHNVSWGHFPSVRPYAQSPAQVLNVARGTHMHWDHADGGRGLGESCTIIYRSQSKRPRTCLLYTSPSPRD